MSHTSCHKKVCKEIEVVIFCSNVPGGNVAVSQKFVRLGLAKRAEELLFIEVNLANGCLNRFWDLFDRIRSQVQLHISPGHVEQKRGVLIASLLFNGSAVSFIG